jgi:hypothetical protein
MNLFIYSFICLLAGFLAVKCYLYGLLILCVFLYLCLPLNEFVQ